MKRIAQTVQRAMTLSGALVLGIGLSMASAQTTSTSGIEGRITDRTGAVLPGVTVTISSPAMQTPQLETVSDGEGRYRFTTLPAGTYSVTFALVGFQTLRREGLQIAVGFIAPIDVSLGVGSLEETVTVSGQSPTVDVNTTTPSTTITKGLLAAVPTTLSLNDTLKLASGIRMTGIADVGGGNSGGNTQSSSAYGTQQGGRRPMLDGVDTHWGGINQGYYDITSMDEVQVMAMGMDAEAVSPGVHINAIIKSGGNQFHGGGGFTYEDDAIQSNNVDAELAAQGVNPAKLNSFYDVNSELGGRIIRDRLWFFGSVHRQIYSKDVVGYIREDGQIGQEDGGLPQQYTIKLTGQVTSKQRVNGFYYYSDKAFPEYMGGVTRPFEATVQYKFTTPRWKYEWTYTPTNSLLINAFGGGRKNTAIYVPNDQDPTCIEVTTNVNCGMYSGSPNKNPTARYQYNGAATYFKSGWMGSHDFKGGVEVTDEDGGSKTPARDEATTGNYTLQFQNNLPFQVVLRNLPIDSYQKVRTQKFFVKDSWRMNGRMTANVGLRYEREHGYVPPQSREAGAYADLYPAASFPEREAFQFNNFAPRLGLAYSLTSDNRTALKVTWGRYNWVNEVASSGLNLNGPATNTYRWNDLNGDRKFQRGEEGTFVTRSGGSTAIVNPDLENEITYEATATIERELLRDMQVRASYVYREETRLTQTDNPLRPYEVYNFPITARDPGPDGITGNGDDGGMVTYYDYDASVRGAAFVRNVTVNYPGLEDFYHNIDLSMSKRLSNRWQVQGNILFSKLDRWNSGGGDVQGPTGSNSSVGGSSIPTTPNVPFPKTQIWEHSLRISGSYELPWGFQTGAVFDHQTGQQLARTARFTQGLNRGGLTSVTMNMEPVGSIQLPAMNLLTLRLEKRFRMGNGQTLSTKFDIHNALNTSAPNSVVVFSGPLYGRVSSLVGPRIAAFGAEYRF